jgi:MFS family permease
VIAISPVVGKLYPRVGPRRLLMVALTVFALSSAGFMLVGLTTSIWWIVALMAVRGVAMGFTFIPAQTATFATIKPHDTGRASSLFNTNRQVAGSLGVALFATVLAQRSTTHVADALKGATSQAAAHAAAAHGQLLGFHDAYFAAALVGILGIAAAFLIHDEDAAETMLPKDQRHTVEVHAL